MEDQTIDTLMNNELESAIKKLSKLEPGSEEYERAAKAVATLRKSIIDAKAQAAEESLANDRFGMEDRAHGDDLVKWEQEKEAKDKMDKVEKRCKVVQTIAGVASAIIPTVLYGLCFMTGLEFEKSGTVTSLVSRQNLSNLFRRK